MRPAFSQEQLRCLAEMQDAWRDERFVLIGALAHGFHVESPRPSEDLDFVIAVERDDLPALVERLPGFVPDDRLEHRWYGPGPRRSRARIDLVPATRTPRSTGSLAWSDGHLMNLVGLDLAFEHAVLCEVSEGVTVNVPPAPVLAFLKMAALVDRPEREKDVGDLFHLSKHYLADDDARRWETPLVGRGLLHHEQSFFAIGYDLGCLAKAPHRDLIEAFCTKPPWSVRAELHRLAPPKDDEEEAVHSVLSLLHRGLRVASPERSSA